MFARFLYPMHADPRDFGLYPWLEVLAKHGRPFRCYCCETMQQPYRPSVFVPDAVMKLGRPWWIEVFYPDGAPRFLPVSSWCVSCAWKLCGRKMVTRRRWWQFWR